MTDNSASDWLDTPSVTSTAKLTREKSRGKRMHGLTKRQTWSSDGEYIYFRRKQANPATLERHERFLRTGNYQHIETQDDVEVYKLLESSPFKRREVVNFQALKFYDARRHTIKAAVARDWAGFIDGLEDLSGRLKAQYHDSAAREAYKDLLNYVFIQIAMRGGPSQAEADREVAALRTRRGDKRSSVLVLPGGVVA